MYGLQKIYFSNSIYKNLNCWIPADGHVNLTAGNGAGKTSTLFLIPAFYGKTHAELVSKHRDNADFKDYYLPYLNSYVAFHYTRDDGDRLVMMYRHTDGEVRYRFIVGCIEETLQSDRIKDMLANKKTAAESIIEIEKMGFEISKPITRVIDYRSIIQNDIQSLGRNGRISSTDRRLASRFGIGGHDSHMRHMHELTFASVTRQGIFGRLHSMICDSMFGNLSIDAKPAYMKDNQMISDIRSLKAFAKNESAFNACIQDAIEFSTMSLQLDGIGKSIKQYLPAEEQRLVDLDEALKALEDTKYIYIDKYDVNFSAISKDLAKAKAQCEQLNNTVERIHGEKSKWEDNDIDKKQQELDNLPTYREEMSSVEEHYQYLVGEVKEEDSRKNSRVVKVREDAMKSSGRIQGVITNLNLEKENINEQLGSDVAALSKNRELELEEHNLITHLSIIDQNSKISKLEHESKSTSKTTEEELKLAEDERSVEQQRLVVSSYQDNIDSCITQEKIIKRDHDSALGDLRKAEDALKKINTEIEKIIAQLYPASGTLLAALKQSGPGWCENIGKVIDPDLLERKDLTPSFSGDGNTTTNIFGWSLDLGQILKPSHCNDDEYLRKLLENKESELRRLNEACEKELGFCNRVKQKLECCQRDLNMAEGLKNTANKVLERLLTGSKRLKQDIKEHVERRKSKAKALLNTASKRLENYTTSRKNDHTELSSTHSETIMERKSKASIDINDVELRIEVQRSEIQNIEKSAAKKIIEIEDAFKLLCENKGIDATVIRNAKNLMVETSRKVERVNGYRGLLEGYRQWVKDAWGKLSEYQARLGEAQITIAKLDEEERVLTEENKLKLKEFKEGITSKTIERNKLAGLIDNANTQITRIGVFSTKAISQPGDFETLIDSSVELFVDKEAIQSKVMKGIDKITKTMNEHPESAVYKAWRATIETAERDSGYQGDTQGFKIYLAGRLEIFYHTQLMTTKKGLAELFRSSADTLNKYYENLGRVNRKVNQVSSELFNKIQQTSTIPDIKSVRCNLVSRVEADESWASLKSFSKDWDSWESTRLADDLPPEGLVQMLIEAIDSLNASKLSSNIKSLVSLSITMEEKGSFKTINSDADFGAVSSNGLCLIATIILFVGLIRYLCPDKNVGVTLPIDELSSISSENIECLLRMFKSENICLFSAHPSNDINILQQFNHLVRVDKDTGIDIVDPASVKEKSDKAKAFFKAIKVQQQEGAPV